MSTAKEVMIAKGPMNEHLRDAIELVVGWRVFGFDANDDDYDLGSLALHLAEIERQQQRSMRTLAMMYPVETRSAIENVAEAAGRSDPLRVARVVLHAGRINHDEDD